LSPEQKAKAVLGHPANNNSGDVQLTVLLDGKPYDMPMGKDDKILDIALAMGLDLPYSCKGGVCCTCRCKVLEGSTEMDKNFTLEKPEVDAGFMLSCQARPTTGKVVVSFDER
jgi:ring-1,2-phenylacetyl-CoA epoxidase subunit PaaE